MPLTLDGTTGVSAVQTGSIQSDDLAAGVGGKVLQVVQSSHETEIISTSESFVDTDLSASITPSSTSSKVLVMVNQPMIADRNGQKVGLLLRVLRNSTVVLSHDSGRTFFFNSDAASLVKLALVYAVSPLDSPNTTSSITYKTQFAVDDSSAVGNVQANVTNQESTITLMEIAG